MGGKLFGMPRMPRAEYLLREARVRAYLDRKLDGRYRIPRSYGDKADFGDMDIIVVSRPDWDTVRAEIARDLGVTAVKAIGHVFSMACDGLQTDFFAVPERSLESTYDFMSFNDLGNLLGRICRRFNLKWGEQGLAYVFRRGPRHPYKRDLPVTQDFAKVCAFLGLDHAAWVAGFPTLRSLYEWVTVSPYFSVAPYLDEDAPGTMAQRRNERTTIRGFIEDLRRRGIEARPAFADRDSYIPMIAAAFPEARLEEMIAVEKAREAEAKMMAEKFSGVLVRQLRPELSGRALSEFIVAFKRSIDDFDAFVRGATPAEIAERIRGFG